MSRFKIGDKVVLISGKGWESREKYKIIESVNVREIDSDIYYTLSNSILEWYDDELKFYSKKSVDTLVDLFVDEVGEYIKLKTQVGDKEVETEFYIDTIKYDREKADVQCYNSSSLKGEIYDDYLTFKSKSLKIKDIKKKMTNEEIEKKLGYEIEIVED